MNKCGYCGEDGGNGRTCIKCTAPMSSVPNTEDGFLRQVRMEPFFYNGYIVYCLRDYAARWVEIQFWLGHDMIERLRFEEHIIEDVIGRDASDDRFMQFFWDLFLVAQGEKKVLDIKAKNMRRIAYFKVTKHEPHRDLSLSMTREELLQLGRIIE